MRIYAFLLIMLSGMALSAQNFKPNYDESKVPVYQLPDLLIDKNNQPVTTADQWSGRRREILSDFKKFVYGKTPHASMAPDVQLVRVTEALNGAATMKQLKLTFRRNNHQISMNLLVLLPADIRPAPVFLGLNFYGNQSIFDDPNIILPTSWIRNNQDFGIDSHQATAASRGVRHSRWPVEKIIARGYGLATIYYGDIDPDKNDFTDGLHPLFYAAGQKHPASDEWGSIGAWAWGLSRAMDYFEADADIDSHRVALMGHSRLGKTSLWAGAQDQRFAIVISNDSGCGGAALSRRRYGETIGRINDVFPHWFCDNFKQFNQNEDALPVDQHMLIAMIAPRPVYVASAVDDRWSDPKGEFLSIKEAGKVYQLLGYSGLPTPDLPDVNTPVLGDRTGYHIRTGGHDVKDFDWQAYLDFADRYFKK